MSSPDAFRRSDSLELEAPWFTPYSACFCLLPPLEHEHQTDEWAKALTCIPVPNENVFAVLEDRLNTVAKSNELGSCDSQGRTLLWHAAYFNDSMAAGLILKAGGARTIFFPTDSVHSKSPYDLSLLHGDPALKTMFLSNMTQRDIDSHHWTSEAQREAIINAKEQLVADGVERLAKRKTPAPKQKASTK
ncbi:hypothetical protein M885DRAFT_610656 [Pelagophyceae sp. CCMP2097]|nr:hypothetical protein M885DRAFT_610656 [Pelagophyceae sp. CCMP2097]